MAPDPAVIGNRVPTGTVSRSPAGGSSAATQILDGAFATVELHALAGDLAQPGEHRRPGGEQRVVDAGRQFGEGGPQPPAALAVAGQQPVHLQSRGQPVRGGPGQSGAVAQFGQPARGIGDGMQYAHGFVEDADAAILSHREILASRMLR